MAFLPGLKNLVFGEAPSVSDRPNLDPNQQKWLDELLSGLQSGGKYDLAGGYTGQLTTPQNKLQGASLAALEQYAMNQVAAGNPNETATNVLSGIANQTPEDLQTYFQRAIFDPTMQQFNQQLMPELTRRFSGQSGFGSDRMQQEQQLAQGVTTGISSQVAQAIQNQNELRLMAAQALPGVASEAINQQLALQRGGAFQQQLDQAPNDAAYGEFQRQQAARAAQIQAILDAIGVRTKTPIVSGGSSGLLGGGIGQGLGNALGKKLTSFF